MLCKQIGDMTLDELVASVYICNKYDHNPIKCIDCHNLANCPGGKRAVEILDNMTSSGLTHWQKTAMTKKAKHREMVKKAVASGDPIKYFMENEGCPTNTAARIRLSRAKKLYPDLFKNNDFRKFRMEDDMKGDYEEALASGDPIKWYMNKFHISYGAAYHRYKYAERKFDTDQNETEAHKENQDEPEEDISLEDFLNQHDSQEEIKAEVENDGNDDFSDLLNAKYEKLVAEREDLLKKIEWYDKAIESLNVVR